MTADGDDTILNCEFTMEKPLTARQAFFSDLSVSFCHETIN